MIILPKLTIITPSLNQEAFIERAILSVLDQGYPNLEYLVYDGGSTDGTIDILRKYSDQIKWVSEKDNGQTDAINKGIRASSGEIITYLNSDDEYEPGALAKVGEYFSVHPDIAWLTGKCRVIDTQGKEIMKAVTIYKNLLLRTQSFRLLKIVNFISQPATFWRKKVVDEIGYLDEKLEYVMDYDLWLRIVIKYPITFINEYLARFRTYPSSKTRQSAIHQQGEEFQVIRKYSKSKTMLAAHYLHRAINVATYVKFLNIK